MNILKIGNPFLLKKTQRVLFPLDNETRHDIQRMIQTLNSLPEAAGLAANQIGIDKQIFVYRLPFNRVQEGEEFFNDIRVLINPTIDSASSELVQSWEGCLSFPEVKLVTIRHKSIHVSGFDEEGVLQEIDASGFFALNIQHEIDHLNGITFFKRMKDWELISTRDEVKNIQKHSNASVATMGNF